MPKMGSTKLEKATGANDMDVESSDSDENTKTKGKTEGNLFLVHRASILEWQPEGVASVCFHATKPKLAVARDNGDIEVWNTAHRNWFLDVKIGGAPHTVARSVVWVGDRLLSAGLQGNIYEWNLVTLQEKRSHESHGGPVWSLALSSSGEDLAAACEDGSIRIFDVKEDNLDLKKSYLSSVNSRTLCVAWHPDGNYFFTGGSDGVVRKWDTSSGNAVSVIANNRQVVIWCIAVLRNFTVITGDSTGKTTFYDGELGVAIDSFAEHAGDVLSIAVDPTETFLVSSGVEFKLSIFRCAKNTMGDNIWFKTSLPLRYHTHDIKTMSFKGDRFVTAGVDANIYVYDLDFDYVQKLSPFPQQSVVSLAREKRVLLCHYSRKLELWKLGEAERGTDVEEGYTVPIGKPNSFLLEMKPKGYNLISSAISPDGQYVACSDFATTKLFRITYDQNSKETKIDKVKKVVIPNLSSSHTLLFTPDSSSLIVANCQQKIIIIPLGRETEITTFDFFDDEEQKNPIRVLTLNHKGNLLACQSFNMIKVYDLESYSLKIVLPVFVKPLWNIEFCKESTLLLAFADRRFYHYDVETQELKRNVHKKFSHFMKQRPTKFTKHPTRDDTVILWGEAHFAHIVTDGSIVNFKGKVVRRYEPMLFVDFVTPNELVVIERPWTRVLEQLPETLDRARFGAN